MPDTPPTLSTFEAAAMSAGLRELFPERPGRYDSFSICKFESLAEIAGVTITKRERAALSLFHCVKYLEMRADEREALVRQCAEILERETVKLPQIEVVPGSGRVLPALDRVVPADELPYRRRLTSGTGV